MSKTVDEMAQIAPQTVARKSSPRRRAARRAETEPETSDQESLENWVQGLSPGATAAIAARTALRVAPLMVRDVGKARSAEDVSAFLVLVNTIFRASALARVAAKYPARANALNAAALVAAARVAAAAAAVVVQNFAYRAVGTVAAALAAAGDAAAAAAAPALASVAEAADDAGPFAIPLEAPARPSFLAAYAAADGAVRAAIRFDASAQQKLGAHGLADLPLWPLGTADWQHAAWEGLKLALARDQDWDVWIDWYEQRLRGGSRGEAYDLVFVSTPLDVWDKGPAAANAWIKEYLHSGGSRPAETPKPLPGRI